MDTVSTFNFNIFRDICFHSRSGFDSTCTLQSARETDEYIEKTVAGIPGREARDAFRMKFSWDQLMERYQDGERMTSLQHWYMGDNGEKRRFVTVVDMHENPVTGNVEGILHSEDITQIYVKDRISDFLIGKGYDVIGIIDLVRDRFMLMNSKKEELQEFVGADGSYTEGRRKIAEETIIPDDRKKFLENTGREAIEEALEKRESYTLGVHSRDALGDIRFVKYSFYYMDRKNKAVLYTVEDVTGEMERDFLTGEFNREGFIKYTEQALAESTKEDHYAILFLDIKKFKILNETIGLQGGDELLRRIPVILRESFLDPMAIARITGCDHFLCLVRQENLNLDKLAKLLHYTYSYGDQTLDTYWLCGIYRITENAGISASAMCDRARIAKEYIRNHYINLYAVYDEAMKEDYFARNEITSALQDSLYNREFKIYYQPIYDACTKKIASAEALIRWDRPDIGLLTPSTFIPALEESGCVSQLDRYVADGVRKFIENRKQKKKFVVPVSVNLSWMDFHDKGMMNALIQEMEKL